MNMDAVLSEDSQDSEHEHGYYTEHFQIQVDKVWILFYN